MAGAPVGNQNARKLKTEELKREAYRQYCEFLAKGYSKDGWEFEHPDLTLTWETMEKYIKEDPIVFEPIKKKVAEAKSFHAWECKGLKMMHGEMKSETALYQMFMRNKFGWDREEKAATDSPKEFDQQLQIIKPVHVEAKTSPQEPKSVEPASAQLDATETQEQTEGA